jgi:hypothetical protein
MAPEDFRGESRALLEKFLAEARQTDDHEMLLAVYADELTRMHGHYAHQLLNDVINDARTRLDARLSPDPIRQTIATVQTTVQDLWKGITQTFSGPPD